MIILFRLVEEAEARDSKLIDENHTSIKRRRLVYKIISNNHLTHLYLFQKDQHIFF